MRLPVHSRGSNHDIRSLTLELLCTSNCTCVGKLFMTVFASFTHRKYQNTPFLNSLRHTNLLGNFYDNENLSAVSFYKNSLILIPTFLTLPSASTSGCENFSLKVFTPANLEESRAMAAMLKSTNVLYAPAIVLHRTT